MVCDGQVTGTKGKSVLVLILILLEYGLRLQQVSYFLSIYLDVLILILLEYGLRPTGVGKVKSVSWWS